MAIEQTDGQRGPADPFTGEEHLQRSLSNRHIQLIAIGGAIGTGLFMGSGKAIHQAGPALLVVYLIIGAVLFGVMRAMGELLLFNLEYKSFQDFAGHLLGPWASYMVGWTYWLCWIVTGTADIVAFSGYIHFWWPDLPVWIAPVLLLAVLLTLNLLTVKLFGELEFWFALIKVVAIVALIVVGIGMLVMGFSHNGVDASLSHLWDRGGLLPTGWTGFFAAFQIAVFAFVGIELVGTTAAEAKNPEQTLPRAVNSIPVRVLLFYVGALVVIMSVTPWDVVDPTMSPFVNLFSLVGLAAAAGVVNFVVATSAASAANSGLFSTSRMIFGLAEERHAPERFRHLSSHKVPARGLYLSVLCLSPVILLLYAGDSVMELFTLVTTISSVLVVVVWSTILVSYIVYRRRYPDAHAQSVFKMPGGSALCWALLGFFAFFIVLLTREEDTLRALLLTPAWFVALAIGWLLVRRNPAATRRRRYPGIDG